MKKITIILGAVLLTGTMFAQKQETGAHTIEMEFAPLGSEPLKINSLRYRYFLSEDLAVRGSLFIGGSRSKTLSDTTGSGGAAQTTSTSGNLDFVLRPGIEKHFDGTEKLSPYVGAELYLGRTSNKDVSEDNWFSDPKKIQTTTTKTSNGSFGLNLVLGTDYYFSDHIYLGAELGFGFLNNGKSKSKTTYENSEDPNQKDTESTGTTSDLSWGPNYQGTIRLGWRFK